MPKIITNQIKKSQDVLISHVRMGTSSLTNKISENIIVENYSSEYVNRTKELDELKKKILGVDKLGNAVDRSRTLTLIEKSGLDNIEYLLTKVKDENIEGDFVETGVWKGGAVIYAKAVINKLELNSKVYVCDSFKGLPPPKPEYKKDLGDSHHTVEFLRVSKEKVQENFNRFGLLDDNVVFVEGWFSDTMPELKTKIDKIAVLRLDGDMYESTIVVLENLYDLVSDGGYIIIDDYSLVGAREATEDFRKQRKIESQLISCNHTIYYWKK